MTVPSTGKLHNVLNAQIRKTVSVTISLCKDTLVVGFTYIVTRSEWGYDSLTPHTHGQNNKVVMGHLRKPLKSKQPYIVLWDELDSLGPFFNSLKRSIPPEPKKCKRLVRICSSPNLLRGLRS